MAIIGFFVFCFITLCSCNFCHGLDCDVPGKCINSHLIGNAQTNNPQECLQYCQGNSDCNWYRIFIHPFSAWYEWTSQVLPRYSHLGMEHVCFIFSDCNTLDTSCQNCYSGQKECHNGTNNCTTINGCCQGTTVDYTRGASINHVDN